MPRYICRACGNIFEEGEGRLIGERHFELDEGDIHYEWFVICPCCGSSQFEEADSCRQCGGAFLHEDLVDGLYCKDCMEELYYSRHAIGFARENRDAFAEYVKEEIDKIHASG